MNTDKKKFFDDLGFISAGSSRKVIIKLIKKGHITPSQIAKESNISLPHVSRTLGELVDRSIVVCHTPKRKKGRIYGLTKHGESLFDKIQ